LVRSETRNDAGLDDEIRSGPRDPVRSAGLPLHRFDLGPKEARELQEELRTRVRHVPVARRPRVVAGADCAIAPGGREILAVVLAFALPGLCPVARAEGRAPLVFPYVPGLLSFREGPALLDAFAKLDATPDAILFDGQGIAHPRRFGLAAHLGLWLGVPTVGVAKSLLCGEVRGAPGPRRGNRRRLTLDGEAVGVVLRTRDGVNPVIVSPGHLADLESAVRLTLACGAGFRLPEPTRLADREVNRLAARLEVCGAGPPAG
jgi:deoxyribonuclease V